MRHRRRTPAATASAGRRWAREREDARKECDCYSAHRAHLPTIPGVIAHTRGGSRFSRSVRACTTRAHQSVWFMLSSFNVTGGSQQVVNGQDLRRPETKALVDHHLRKHWGERVVRFA
jgi:hypothetical protein